MDLTEVCYYTGLSERTLRRWIQTRKLDALQEQRGSTRRWEITAAGLAWLRAEGHWLAVPPVGQAEAEKVADGIRQEVDADDLQQANSGEVADGHRAEGCSRCAWLEAFLERQLSEKDAQIRELHVLLQRSQDQSHRTLPEPAQRHWWKFWLK